MEFTLTRGRVGLRFSSWRTRTECHCRDAIDERSLPRPMCIRGSRTQNDSAMDANNTPTALEAEKDRDENDRDQAGHGRHDRELKQPA
jgi:hypothetical protein